MDLSITDGIFWTVYSNMTTPYLVAFALLIIGPTAPVGYIIGIPYLIVPLAQYAAIVYSRRSPDLRNLTIKITLFDRIIWIAVSLLIFLRGYLLISVLLISFLTFRIFFSSFSGTTWTSWVPAAIGSKKRNLYFSKRNFFLRFFSLVGYGISSAVFFLLGDTREAYLTLFLGSLIFSTISLMVMRRIPPFKAEKEEGTVSDTTKRLFSYLIFTLLTGIGLSAFSPYLQLYILSTNFLGLSPEIYTLVITVIALSAISSQIYWGRLIEKIGNLRAILISGVAISIVPLLTSFTHSFLILMLAVILLGLMQSGFTLAAFNELIFRSEKRRISGVSVYSLVQALSVGAGPVIANFLFDINTSSLGSVFILCSALILTGSVYYYSIQRKERRKAI